MAYPVEKRAMTLDAYRVLERETGVRHEFTNGEAYAMAGIDRDDLDGFYTYDAFTPLVVFALERFGLTPPGEGHAFVRTGLCGSRSPSAKCTDQDQSFDHGLQSSAAAAGTRISRVPLGCSGPTNPAASIDSTMRAARL